MSGSFDMNEEELRHRLVELDRAVALRYPGRTFRIVFVGGGAMVLLGCLARSTADLDALEVPPDLLELMAQFDINCRVKAYLDSFAYNLEDRLVRVEVETKAAEYFTASLEDVVASKLHSDRPVDEFDVRRPEVLEALDWELLDRVVSDMEGTRMNDRRHNQFLFNYREYRQEFGPCDA